MCKTLRELYRDSDIPVGHIPFSDKEFTDYLMECEDTIIQSVINAGQLIYQLDSFTQKGSLKATIADFIIDELVINRIIKEPENVAVQRAYAYYRMFLK